MLKLAGRRTTLIHGSSTIKYSSHTVHFSAIWPNGSGEYIHFKSVLFRLPFPRPCTGRTQCCGVSGKSEWCCFCFICSDVLLVSAHVPPSATPTICLFDWRRRCWRLKDRHEAVTSSLAKSSLKTYSVITINLCACSLFFICYINKNR